MSGSPPETDRGTPLSRRHGVVGWWALALFLSLGLVLESFHGFGISFYLDNEARRLLWRLAHAHGTLLAIVNLLFAMTAPWLAASPRAARVASRCLLGATILLPGGFFAGGIVVHGNDPNLSILAVPVGAALLFTAVVLTAARVSRG